MKIRSFQLRIALVSLFLSGLSLVVFGVLAWTFFYRMGLERIDLEVQSWGKQQLSKYRLIREWERFERDMRLVFGQQGQPAPVLLLAKDRTGQLLYQSHNWPASLNTGDYPSPEKLKIPVANSPEGRRPPPPREDRPSPPLWDTAHFVVPGPFRTVQIDGGYWRLGVMANEHATMALGVSLNSFLAEMRRVRLAFLTAMPAALLLVAAAGWLVSRRALRPVRQVTQTAQRITAQGLDQRIPIKTADYEFAELVAVLNQMLDRLQKSFQQATRFSADAAHELKTPLTILQGSLEQALREAPENSTQQRILEDLMGESLRLKAIVQKLLLLSRADAGQLQLQLEPIDLTELIEELADDAAIMAPQLKIDKELIPNAWVQADGDLLRQALQNLSSNAIKYNCEDGLIRLRLSREADAVKFTIANTGQPIAPEDRGKIFDRFYRGDKSRGRRVDGVGLGLALAREIIRAHHGELALDLAAGDMTAFTVALPCGRNTDHSPDSCTCGQPVKQSDQAASR